MSSHVQRQLAAFILAGGKSSRMGEDKALLELEGRTLLERAIRKAREVSPVVSVVGSRDRFGTNAIEDIFPNCGPLGGIHAALSHSSREFNLMLAVDMPAIETAFLRYLFQQAQSSQAVVTVPRTSDGFQPLCAVYHKNFYPVAEAALTEGRFKIDALFPLASLRVIDEAEMRKFAFDPAMFQNLNTRDEYERAKTRAR